MLTASDHSFREASRAIDALVLTEARAKNVPVTAEDAAYVTRQVVHAFDPSRLPALAANISPADSDTILWFADFYLDRIAAFYAILATIRGLLASGREVEPIPDDAMHALITDVLVAMGVHGGGRTIHYRWPAEAFGAVRPAFLQ